MRAIVLTGVATTSLLIGGFLAEGFALRDENASEGAAIVAHKASFHVPVFQNDLVRLLNVDIPAGQSSGYHTHYPDLVTVVVEDTDSVAQELGREPNPSAHQPRGNAAFTAYYAKPITHSVANMGHSPYHIIAFELLKSQPSGFAPSSRSDVPGYVRVFDNERVRAWRLVLEPGQSVAAIAQQAPGLRIVVDGGEITEMVPGQAERGMLLRSGEFAWQDSGVTRGIRNRGSTSVEFVEFELK